MVKGIGVDLCLITRFVNPKVALVNKVLTKHELALYNQLIDDLKPNFLASRFAAKEAYFKANNNQKDLGFDSISVLNDLNGKPYILDHPNVLISLSHDNDYVIAFIVIQD